MAQAWTKSGKRCAITRLHVDDNLVIGEKTQDRDGYTALQVAFGTKKLKNMSKPLRSQVEKSGFSVGAKKIREIKVDSANENPAVGQVLSLDQIVTLGDVVHVQGISKGRGFAGGMKRHGFHGGPKTRGQSDRQRSPGSIGAGTTPGRVLKGKRMAGQYGTETKTIKNLQIVHIDPELKEIWVNGPIPGHFNSLVRLTIVENKEFEGLGAGAPVVEVKAETVETVEATAEVEEVKE